jgi:uncharacterized RmlC-like cupin family protein
VPSVIYAVTGCHTKLYGADGKTREVNTKPGSAFAAPVVAAHSAENVGPEDCHEILVERK